MEHLPHGALRPTLTAGPRAAGPTPACSQGLMGQPCCMDSLRSPQLGGSKGLMHSTAASRLLAPLLFSAQAAHQCRLSVTAPPLFCFAGSIPGVADGAALELTCHRKSGKINNQNHNPFQTSQVTSTLTSHESSFLPQFYKADSITPFYRCGN